MEVAELNYSGQLTITTCWCGMTHAVPKELYDFTKQQHNDGKSQPGISCPLDRMRKERAAAILNAREI